MRIAILLFVILIQTSCGGGDDSSDTAPIASVNDVSPPAIPTQTLSNNTDGTLSISGTAEASSTVTVTFPDGSSQTIAAKQNGEFGPVVSALPQPNGLVSTTATDSSGNTSEPIHTDYADGTAPLAPNQSIVVNDNGTVSVKGTAEPLSTVSVTFADGQLISVTANSQGNYGPVTSSERQYSGELTIRATDLAGNGSIAVAASYQVPFENALWELVANDKVKDIVRFLTQATFGATEETIQRLIATDGDYESWIDEQIGAQQTSVVNKFERRAEEAGIDLTSRTNLDLAYQKQLIASDMLWDTFAKGEDQLRQRVAFALSQIFVVSEISDTLFNNAHGVVAYHDMLAEHALGNYRDLIEAVTLSPVMGEYLSMIRNEKANAELNIRPDENYARELMQLFSIGLVMLNQDGSVQTDEQGHTIPTYDQDIIKSFARVFTGWTYNNANFWQFEGWLNGDMLKQMKAFIGFHDTDEKTLLNGEVLPAGQTADQNLQGALDNIFNHQNVPPFISKQLIQRLVTSNPSPAYIERISRVFSDNGQGVRGDLAAVVKAILLDEEARNGHVNNPTTFGKVKEPILKFTALIRAFNVDAQHPINEAGTLASTLRYFWAAAASGQRPYGAPSVFNFFQPDHSPSGSIRDAGLVAPELQILNESFITNATNYGSATIFNSYDFLLSDCQDRLDYLDGFGCPYPDFTAEIALASNSSQLLSRLNLLLLAGDMSAVTQEALTELAAQQSEDRFVVAEVVHLIYISPEFAVQR